MKARTSVLIVLLLALFCFTASASGKKISFKGRIAARRPSDGMQVASFVINQELFLFRTEDGKWLKLVYRHHGYSDMKGDIRSGSQDISISVQRNPSCDQTVGAFEKEAPAVPLEGASAAASTERVVFASSVSRPPESYQMKCYVLEHWEPVSPGNKSSKAEVETVTTH